jgi:hypothetical protein
MTFTVNIEAIHACLSSLGLLNTVDSSVFYNELEQQAAKFKVDQANSSSSSSSHSFPLDNGFTTYFFF